MGKAHENLLLAQQAVRYVQEYISVGAGNKLGDVIGTGGSVLSCVADARDARGKNNITSLEGIRFIARQTERTGCGNCGEQSAIAFMFLYERKVLPLDIMAVKGRDHNYVVIGRAFDEGTGMGVAGWGEDAVVCDPWKGKAYLAGDFYWNMTNRNIYWNRVFRAENP